MQNHESTMACGSSLTASRIADMCVCVCAEPLEVEVTIRYQLVVQWLECSLTMTEDSGSIPGISDY
jgi:diaminopimelate epimerase